MKTMSNSQTKLRKAAILVSNLDSASADALLDQMSAEQAAHVRAAVMALGDVSPHETESVLRDFLRGQQRTISTADAGVEIESSLAARFTDSATYAPPPLHKPRNEPHAEKPFFFLNDAPLEAVVRYLEREHPQTIAVVVSHLQSQRAAEIVQRLPERLQADVLRRVSQVDETDPEVLRDLEISLREIVRDEIASSSRPAAGFAVAQAIVAAASGLSGQVKRQLTDLLPAATTTAPPVALQRNPLKAKSFAPSRITRDESSIAEELPSDPFDFEDLKQLTDRSLGFVFQKSEPHVALLALAGADRDLFERIVRQLPANEAKLLRGGIRKIGPLRLADMTTAQTEFAKLAGQLLAKGLIQTQSRLVAA